ncbi:MAG: hypothetical protein DMF61_04070 [Blastocatellia bacterium AA13]|nr:MAG: hypothetical protein DMF61_04070 [Blastocatellia bacterium AA13]
MKKLAKLRQLRKMSAEELRVRSEQEVAKWQGRFLNRRVGEMSDSEFQRAVLNRSRGGSSRETAERIMARVQASVESPDPSRFESPDTSKADRGQGRSDSDIGIATEPFQNSPAAFFPSTKHRTEIAALMRSRFPESLARLEESAQRAIDGCFNLLGYEGLRFGEDEIDWRLEPIAGKRTELVHWSRIDYLDPNTAGDCKITWELNRHAHFVTLAQMYFLTGEDRYAEAFVSQATSWMDANPPERGINWASSLELAIRAIAWLWALHLFAGAETFSSEFKLRFLKHLVQHGRHICEHLSHYFSPNTHLTGEALGLFYLGVALPELTESESWREIGARILIEQLSIQIRGDGVYFEQASYYHRYTTDFYLHFVLLAKAAGIELPLEVRNKLSKLLNYLMWITRPDGSSPLVGDDDGGRLITFGQREPDDFRDTLAIGAAMLDRSDLKYVAGKATSELLWLLGPESLRAYYELASEPPLTLSRAFDAGGYYVMRDGWERESSFALIDCGPHGSLNCGHAHSDALAIEFSALGKTWLVDPGTFVYTGDEKMRDWFRTTEAHNTVAVDGRSQSQPAGPFSWTGAASSGQVDFLPGSGIAFFKGSHSGYARLDDPVHHTRSVALVRAEADALPGERLNSYLIVRDRFDALARHRYSFLYHFPSSCKAVAHGPRITVARRTGENLTIALFGATQAQARVTSGWVSNCYGRREPADMARFDVDAVGPQTFTTVILPATSRQRTSIEAISFDEEFAQNGFQIASGEMLDVLLTDGEAASSLGIPQIGGEGLAWGRFVSNKLIRVCFICGQRSEEWLVDDGESCPDHTESGRGKSSDRIEKVLIKSVRPVSIKASSGSLQGNFH